MKLDLLLKKISLEENSAFFYTPSIYSESRSYIFTNPVEVVETSDPLNIEKKLLQVDKLVKKGLTGYGYITFEAGYLFEERLKRFCISGTTLLKFCFFKEKNVEIIKSSEIKIDEWDEKNFKIKDFKLNTSKEKYFADIERIKTFIAEGDTYQVNYTANAHFQFLGSPAEFFKMLIFNQSARYTAYINSGDKIILSVSPELFFKQAGNSIITKPMKGTMGRGFNIKSDQENLSSLKKSDKNIAENLMIVDLLRNDLGKISSYGSVEVEKIFNVEKYELLYQKVSSVKSKLKNEKPFSEIIKNLFPSGSITGAPKIRTMQIIKELETEPRGIYTGCIGMINKSETVFNVAIRTIEINRKNNGKLGIGSGIVWDSDPESEYNEMILKSNFLLKPEKYFELFETMLIEKGKVYLLDEHLLRLKNSAEFFLFKFSKNKILNALNKSLRKIEKQKKYRLKLKLNKYGVIKTEIEEYYPYNKKINVVISDKRISSINKFQYFKTTNRSLYDEELHRVREGGNYEVLFLNERDEICEGAISNIFVKLQGRWYTPPVESGLLPGVFRKQYLKKHSGTEERTLYLQDLKNAEEIALTNSLRGWNKVDNIDF